VFFLERLVNITVEKTRTKERASISEGAVNIGIPRMLVDVRHGKKLLRNNINLKRNINI
jgi:hypothetical protein